MDYTVVFIICQYRTVHFRAIYEDLCVINAYYVIFIHNRINVEHCSALISGKNGGMPRWQNTSFLLFAANSKTGNGLQVVPDFSVPMVANKTAVLQLLRSKTAVLGGAVFITDLKEKVAIANPL